MSSKQEPKAVGRELVQYAMETKFSRQRGIVDELFPYMFLAARKMTSRQISAWLQKEKGIKLSFVSIAKALREPDKHWEAMAERVEPAARVLEEAYRVHMRDLLSDKELFEKCRQETPEPFKGKTDRPGWGLACGEIGYAFDTLDQEWFWFDDRVRMACLEYMRRRDREAEHEDAQQQ